MNNRNWFLTILEAEVQDHGWVPVRTLFQILDFCFLIVSSYGGKRERALWGPFYKGTKPIYEGFTLMT